MKNRIPELYRVIHSYCSENKEILNECEVAVCFYCKQKVLCADIDDWCDELSGKETAICPHCGIDSVVPYKVDDVYYVIELKKDSGYDDAYVQTKAYVDWIQKHLAKSKHKTYGIICLNSPTKQLIEKVRNDDLIKLFEYNISYSEIQ